jgi:pyridoxamine 5'-phosphate oxidase
MTRSKPRASTQPKTDPIARFEKWFDDARNAGVSLPEAMALATAERGRGASVRFVLLKQADSQGFVFYTDERSQKGVALRRNPHASLAFYWDPIGKQVRVEGRVERISAEEADAYWATRPRESRLSASVSRQSARLADRSQLTNAVKALREKLKGCDIPRPRYWIGFRLVPDSIEFWTRRSHRLHERDLFVRTRGGWKKHFLQP